MQKNMDKRLSIISSMVREGTTAADVGCDHGILITSLVEDKHIKKGIALDINELPLEKARMRVKAMGMENIISCRLGDGLSLVSENEAEDIVIAGMGGELIYKIISSCPWKYKKGKRFILNPMTKASFLRISMAAEGFSLLEEKAAKVNGKHYSVMLYEYTGEKKSLTELDTFSHIGLLANEKDEDAREYIEGQIKMITKKAKGLSTACEKEGEKYFLLAEKLKEAL